MGGTGVNVAGSVYDFEIVEGTCVDLYDGCDEPSDFTFTTVEAAALAARALQDQVILDGGAGNFDSVPNLTAGCSGAFCGTAFPYALLNATEVSVVSAVNQDSEPGDVPPEPVGHLVRSVSEDEFVYQRACRRHCDRGLARFPRRTNATPDRALVQQLQGCSVSLAQPDDFFSKTRIHQVQRIGTVAKPECVTDLMHRHRADRLARCQLA